MRILGVMAALMTIGACLPATARSLYDPRDCRFFDTGRAIRHCDNDLRDFRRYEAEVQRLYAVRYRRAVYK